ARSAPLLPSLRCSACYSSLLRLGLGCGVDETSAESHLSLHRPFSASGGHQVPEPRAVLLLPSRFYISVFRLRNQITRAVEKWPIITLVSAGWRTPTAVRR